MTHTTTTTTDNNTMNTTTTTTTTTGFDLPAHVIRAALVAAAKQDVRYYLNAVLIERAGPDAVRVVSTDGHRLFVGRVTRSHDIPSGGSVHVPRAQIDAVLRAGTRDVRIEFSPKPASDGMCVFYPASRVVARDALGAETSAACDVTNAATFPNWRRVVPTVAARAPNVPAPLNCQYLVDAERALRTFSGASKKTQQAAAVYAPAPDEAAVVTMEGVDGFVVIMSLPAAAAERTLSEMTAALRD